MHTTRFILTTFSVFLLYFLPSPAQTVTMTPGQDKQYLKMINPEDIEPVPGYQIVYGKLNGLDAARTSRGYFVVGSVVYVDANLNATVLTAQTNLLNDDKDGPVRLERIRYAKNPYYQRFSIPGGHLFNTFVIVPGKTAKDTKILSFKKHGIPQKCTRDFRYVLEDEDGTRTFVCWYNKDKKAYMDWLDEDGKVLERKEFLRTIADEKFLDYAQSGRFSVAYVHIGREGNCGPVQALSRRRPGCFLRLGKHEGQNEGERLLAAPGHGREVGNPDL